MHEHQGFSPGGRDRALRRLARLTAGAAVGGLAAVVGFGAIAANAFAGKPATAATSTAPSNTTTTTPTPAASSGSLQPAPTPPTSGGGRASATTGAT